MRCCWPTLVFVAIWIFYESLLLKPALGAAFSYRSRSELVLFINRSFFIGFFDTKDACAFAYSAVQRIQNSLDPVYAIL